VRLKEILGAKATETILLFQFLLVRLKAPENTDKIILNAFQFLLVRLKESRLDRTFGIQT